MVKVYESIKNITQPAQNEQAFFITNQIGYICKTYLKIKGGT